MFVDTEILKAISFKETAKLPRRYWILVLLRFLFTILPQRGYIHPDEFFQNVEVIAGDIFSIDVSKTWEFDPKFPIRNIFVPKMILGPPLHFIQFFNPYFKHYVGIDLKTPYYLLVIPRLFICFLSLINDFCLYRICVLYGQNFRHRLTIFASSYVVFVYCCRSFSNTFETILFSMLLLIVAETMQKSDKVIYHNEFLKEKYEKAATTVEKVKIFKLSTHLPQHSLNNVIILATIVVVGIFNRPTFVCFAFAPIFFWLHRGLGSTVVGFKDFHFRIFTFIMCGVPSALLLILVDSGYYGYITMADVESLQISWDNWVVTPLNFLRYNSDTGNLKKHGLHPRWLHVVVNVPLLFNVLGILAIIMLSVNAYRFVRGQYSKLPRIQSITGLMMFSLVIPIAVLSYFPHQEARFIVPVVVPLIYLFGNYLYSNEIEGRFTRKWKFIFRYVWYLINILLAIFFGLIHQGGIYPLAKSIHHDIKKASNYGQHTYVVTTHSYSIPTYLLQLESTTKVYKDKKTGHKYRLSPTTFIHKYGSIPVDALFDKVDTMLTNAERLKAEHKKKYKFYIVTPCSLDIEVKRTAAKYNYFKLDQVGSYFPHFTSEALPTFPGIKHEYCARNSSVPPHKMILAERLACYLSMYCLKNYQVRVIATKLY